MNSTKYDENIKLMLKATKMNDLEPSILPAPDLDPHDHAAKPDEHAKDTHYPDISRPAGREACQSSTVRRSSRVTKTPDTLQIESFQGKT